MFNKFDKVNKKIYHLICKESGKIEREEYLTEFEAKEHNRTLRELQEPYQWEPFDKEDSSLVPVS